MTTDEDAEINPMTTERVWVPDAREVWRLATTISGGAAAGDDTVVEVLDPSAPPCENGAAATVQYTRSQTHQYDPSHAIDLDDLAMMNSLHEGPLLHVLQRRCASGGGA